ncbi:prealbumin-like fold domain-containing protein [Salinilacustrithrix flava]|uniref:prealbumin-like fold domain-containing protein n=1 Tax=Salinilacustrithrix flava TaxID=2957203 RepID=UPI003D7C2E55
MLIGALMVLAPGAGAVLVEPDDPRLEEGGNLLCESLDPAYTASAKNEAGATSGTISGSGFAVSFELLLNAAGDADNEMEITVLEGSRAVYAVIVKTGNAGNENSNGFTAYEEFSPALVVGETGSVGYPTTAVSNIRVCGKSPSLTVTKNIASEDSTALAQTFFIDVEGTNGDSDTLGDDEFIEIDDASGEYVITETLPETDWEDPQITCGDAVTSTNEAGDFVVTVSNVDVDCIVTNTPETPTTPPSLTVTKNIASEDSTALAETFFIDVAGTNGDSDTLGDDEFIEIDDASGEYVITETLPETGWDDPQITCGDAVTSTNEAGDFVVTVSNVDVDCIVTNTPEEDTPTTIPPPVPTPEADLRIVKAVTGDVPDDWSASFRGVPGNELTLFQLSEGNETEAFLDITPGTVRVRELASSDSELVDIDCEGTELWEEDGDAVEVTLVDDDDVTCTFTNFYPEEQVLPEEEEPGSITIVKAVQGPVPPEGWAFGFDVSDGLGQVILTNADADETFNSVEAGQYTIVEHDNSVTTLGSIVCDDPDAVSNGRTVTVDVSEGEDVTCTFTNVFPAPAQADTEVQGDVITRTLPRTGDETRNLAGLGAFMLALGAAMVLGSKRQLASR